MTIKKPEELYPKHFHNLALAEFERFMTSKGDPNISLYIETYSKLSLPFCQPSFQPIDPDNPTHRFDDQVIKGFPFTSASWPWPSGKKWKYMQPAAQINLERASILLGTDLGKGLLQVWIDDLKPVTRIIPLTSLSEPLDLFYPETPPWGSSDEECSECVIWRYSYDVPYPRIEWLPMGPMLPRVYETMIEWCEKNTDFSIDDQEALAEEIESLKIPCRLWDYFDNDCSIRLGGYPDGLGNDSNLIDWPSSVVPPTDKDKKMLLYIRGNEDGPVFCLGVSFRRNKTGEIIFEARISCDN